MISVKSNKIYILALYAVEFFLGIYIASIRLTNANYSSLSETFIAARETDYLDLTGGMFDLQVVISVLPLIISIPLICSVFSKNYTVKCYYAATRKKRYVRFYFGEMLSLVKYCFVSELMYSLGLLLYSLWNNESPVIDKDVLVLLGVSILNSSIILYLFVIAGAVLSVLISSKGGLILSVAISLVCTAVLFVLPVHIIQFDIISWFFLSVFKENSMIFTYDAVLYYLVAVFVLIVISCLGGFLLKNKDVLKEE